ncbi:TPA: trp operon leader peptide [Salmonella enterica]|nr:trp operon leader peptide [Salmonella enterica]HCL4861465.1 trp operon leader peptide [Salmonella enterica]
MAATFALHVWWRTS